MNKCFELCDGIVTAAYSWPNWGNSQQLDNNSVRYLSHRTYLNSILSSQLPPRLNVLKIVCYFSTFLSLSLSLRLLSSSKAKNVKCEIHRIKIKNRTQSIWSRNISKRKKETKLLHTE